MLSFAKDYIDSTKVRSISEKNASSQNANTIELVDPPFYLNQFEEAFRYIIDEYQIPHQIGRASCRERV